MRKRIVQQGFAYLLFRNYLCDSSNLSLAILTGFCTLCLQFFRRRIKVATRRQEPEGKLRRRKWRQNHVTLRKCLLELREGRTKTDFVSLYFQIKKKKKGMKTSEWCMLALYSVMRHVALISWSTWIMLPCKSWHLCQTYWFVMKIIHQEHLYFSFRVKVF